MMGIFLVKGQKKTPNNVFFPESMGAGVGAVLVTDCMKLHNTLTYITIYNEY